MPIDDGLFVFAFSFNAIVSLFLSRQKALKALNDRMKSEKTGVDSWPEMDDPSQTPLLPSTHSNDPTSVTIEMNKDNLNQSSTSSST